MSNKLDLTRSNVLYIANMENSGEEPRYAIREYFSHAVAGAAIEGDIFALVRLRRMGGSSFAVNGVRFSLMCWCFARAYTPLHLFAFGERASANWLQRTHQLHRAVIRAHDVVLVNDRA